MSNQNTPKIADISKIINPVEYPVEITLSCVRVIDNNTYEELSLSDIPSDVSLNADLTLEVLFAFLPSHTVPIHKQEKAILLPDYLCPSIFAWGMQKFFLCNIRPQW